MKTPQSLCSKLAPLGFALALASAARADFNPVALTTNSYNAAVVVPKGAPTCFNSFVNVTMDGGTNNNANTWYEQGYGPASNGLPVHGAVFTSASNPDHNFQMPPDYTTNNCVFVGGANAPGGSFNLAVATGTLTLVTPTVLTNLSVLYAGGGANTINYTVHYLGGGTQPGQFATTDWFNGAAGDWVAQGRVNMDDGTQNTLYSTTQTKLFHNDIFLTDSADAVTSIDFTYVSGNSRSFFFGLSGSTNSPTNPVYTPLAVTGFNKDVVVEATAPHVGSFFNFTTVTMDASTNNTGNTWYEKGLDATAATTGIPVHGSTFTNAAGNHAFTMPPTYVGNDCAFVAPAVPTATLTPTPAAAYYQLSFLNAAGNGPCVVTVTVNHADATTETFTLSSLDWFNGATATYAANGRYQTDNGNFNNVNGGACKLFNTDFTLADSNSPVTSIGFAYVSGGRACIFAVSGNSFGTTTPLFQPIAVTGYNQDIVVEATEPYNPGNIYSSITASMDNGLNLFGNTWYEQGYYSVMPGSGLPPAGSTITSLNLPDHHYQFAPSYTNNNAIYCDSNHPTATVGFANPTTNSALSFLSANANGPIQVNVILNHTDGTSETNVFNSKDWFNGTPFAFDSYGRVVTDRRTINSDPGRSGSPSNPRLYEAQFFLNDFNSPTTNAVFTWTTNNGAGGFSGTASRFVIMAVSGAVGPVVPLIQNQPASLTLFEGSNATFSATSTGTPPLTNQWQVSPDGTNWSNLTDGGQITGSATGTLHVNTVGLTNAAFYQDVISNVVGSQTTLAATLTVRSAYPDVTVPSDPVASYQPNGGTSPANAVAADAIGDVVGVAPGEYANINNTAAPFTGPVGLIVTPARGSTILKALRLYASPNTQAHDPADFALEGSNDGGNTWTLLQGGLLALPAGRNAASPAVALNALTQSLQEFDFYVNTSAYLTYRLQFTNIFTDAGNNEMELGQAEFLGITNPVVPPPVITRQPQPSITNYVGGEPAFGLSAIGTPPLSYQWSRNGTPIPGATNAIYTTNPVTVVDSLSSFSCVVSNLGGATPSTSSLLTVIAAPTNSYKTAIIADGPSAYWPLSEPDNGSGNAGVAAIDYMGGHNGVYTNTTLGVTGFNTNADPDTAALFGSFAPVDSFVGQIQDINFAAPTNTSKSFSVEAWVLNNPSTVQDSDAGLVTKGFGGGGEQFNLDCGSSGASHKFRFFVRDITGNTHNSANGSIGPTNQNGPFPSSLGLPSWHHVVGVCDEPHSNVLLYVDGLVNAAASGVTPFQGVQNSPLPVTIGSRTAANGLTSLTNQFLGTIEEVAIYPVALTSNQVLNHYYAAEPCPVFTVQPTNTTAGANGRSVLLSSAYGPPPQSYQWYQSIDGGATFQPLAGATSNNLFFASTPITNNGYEYYVVATNNFCALTSSVAILTVVSGPPVFSQDLPTNSLVYAGGVAQLSVLVDGTAPFFYQWTSNSVNLSDSGRLSGSHSNTLTIVNSQIGDSAVYQVSITNAQSTNVGGPLVSTPCSLYVESTPDFNTNGLGWSFNGVQGANPSPATIAGNALTLTIDAGSTARSAWYNYPLYVGAFYASFVYLDAFDGGSADGTCLVLQNDPRGTSALGGAGGSLGVSGVTPSVELELNIYAGVPANLEGVGFGVDLNGALGNLGGPYVTNTGALHIDSGNPINVSVLYDGQTIHLTMTDPVAPATYTTNMTVGSVPTFLGTNIAWVGFTGADGGVFSEQVVSNFFYVPIPTLSALKTSSNAITFSWPSGIGGYNLQVRTNSTLTVPSGWQNVTNPVTQANALNQVIISPLNPTNKFYRLALPTFGSQ